MRFEVRLEGRLVSSHPTRAKADKAAKAITAGSVKIIDLDPPKDPPKPKTK